MMPEGLRPTGVATDGFLPTDNLSRENIKKLLTMFVEQLFLRLRLAISELVVRATLSEARRANSILRQRIGAAGTASLY